jgi:hypothetical protein
MEACGGSHFLGRALREQEPDSARRGRRAKIYWGNYGGNKITYVPLCLIISNSYRYYSTPAAPTNSKLLIFSSL